MKITFVKSAIPIGYGYFAGDSLDCPEAFGKEMVDLGYAKTVTNSASGLPEDLPGREALEKAGFMSVEDVKAIQDLTEIDGIGKSTADKIFKYFLPKE